MAAKALEYGGKYLRRAVENGEDVEARGAMMLGASLAGVGFGSAGVHIPHACSYPIAGLKHEYQPPGYPQDHPFVPHGWSVIVTAPAAFRFTYDASLSGTAGSGTARGRDDREGGREHAAGDPHPAHEGVGAPKGVRELGYSEDDIDELVEGAMKQQRLLVGTPKERTEEDLANILRESMDNW